MGDEPAIGRRTGPGEGVRPGRRSRVFDRVLLLVSVVALVDPLAVADANLTIVGESVWTLLALAYVAVRLRRLRHARRGRTAWAEQVSSPRVVSALSVVAVLQLLGNGLEVVGAPLEPVIDEDVRGFFMVVVAVAWLVVHLSYADRYAHAVLAEPGAIEFPGTAVPGPVEFTYFAFAVGTSFAVPDATVRTTALRATVMRHAVLSFVSNTVILGVIVGLLTG